MVRFLPALLAPLVFAPLFFLVSYSGPYGSGRQSGGGATQLARLASSVRSDDVKVEVQAPAVSLAPEDRKIEAAIQAFLKPARFGRELPREASPALPKSLPWPRASVAPKATAHWLQVARRRGQVFAVLSRSQGGPGLPYLKPRRSLRPAHVDPKLWRLQRTVDLIPEGEGFDRAEDFDTLADRLRQAHPSVSADKMQARFADFLGRQSFREGLYNEPAKDVRTSRSRPARLAMMLPGLVMAAGFYRNRSYHRHNPYSTHRNSREAELRGEILEKLLEGLSRVERLAADAVSMHAAAGRMLSGGALASAPAEEDVALDGRHVPGMVTGSIGGSFGAWNAQVNQAAVSPWRARRRAPLKRARPYVPSPRRRIGGRTRKPPMEWDEALAGFYLFTHDTKRRLENSTPEEDAVLEARLLSMSELTTPIVLDLNDDGRPGKLAGHRIDDGWVDPSLAKSFDFDGDGRPERMEWYGGGGDGLLCVDLDGNGSIDSGLELFGSAEGHRDGYARLAERDRDGDGEVSGPELEGLLVWIDDGDARCEPGELRSVSELGIELIACTHSGLRSSFVRRGRRYLSWDWCCDREAL